MIHLRGVMMEKNKNQLITEVTTNFKRGVTDMLLLSLLLEGEQYAYELSKRLRQYSCGLFDIQGPSLYTVLYRLEQKGYVATREEQVGRRIRVYYRIVQEGREYLELVTREYSSITNGIASVLEKTAHAKGRSTT